MYLGRNDRVAKFPKPPRPDRHAVLSRSAFSAANTDAYPYHSRPASQTFPGCTLCTREKCLSASTRTRTGSCVLTLAGQPDASYVQLSPRIDYGCWRATGTQTCDASTVSRVKPNRVVRAENAQLESRRNDADIQGIQEVKRRLVVCRVSGVCFECISEPSIIECSKRNIESDV